MESTANQEGEFDGPRENLNVPNDQNFKIPTGIGSMDAIKARLSAAGMDLAGL
jgi:hypothetical protein